MSSSDEMVVGYSSSSSFRAADFVEDELKTKKESPQSGRDAELALD
jgi:hypothetical protein